MSMKPPFNQNDYVCIYIKDLIVDLFIGLFDHERTEPQPVSITLKLYAEPDYLQSVSADHLIDYSLIADEIMQWTTKPHIDLLETLAQQLTELSFSYQAVEAVKVYVSKPKMLPGAKSAGVEIFTRRPDSP